MQAARFPGSLWRVLATRPTWTRWLGHTGVSFTAAESDALVNSLNAGRFDSGGRVGARWLKTIASSLAKRNAAFVLMQYFGYLRRDPDEVAYQFWLKKLNDFNGNFEQAEMVKAFTHLD